MKTVRLTEAQERTLRRAAGACVRQAGAFGEQRGSVERGFERRAHIDALLSAGLLRPSPYWGRYEATPVGREWLHARDARRAAWAAARRTAA